jgi:hypothetical protein
MDVNPEHTSYNLQSLVFSNRPFAKKDFIFFLESTIKNKLKSKISEF